MLGQNAGVSSPYEDKETRHIEVCPQALGFWVTAQKFAPPENTYFFHMFVDTSNA
jgi:hypothetical protein